MEQDKEVRHVQKLILQVLREYKKRGIEAVEEDVLRKEVERRWLVKQDQRKYEDAKNDFYNHIVLTMEACDPDIREKLGKLFDELRRVNREANKLLREQENRWFSVK